MRRTDLNAFVFPKSSNCTTVWLQELFTAAMNSPASPSNSSWVALGRLCQGEHETRDKPG